MAGISNYMKGGANPQQYAAGSMPQSNFQMPGPGMRALTGALVGASGKSIQPWLQQLGNLDRESRLMPYQAKMMNMKMAAMDRAAETDIARQEHISNLPEGERQMAIMGGDSYWASKFPAAKAPFSVAEGASVYHPSTGKYSQPEGIIGGQQGTLLGKSNFLKEYTGSDWTNESFAKAYAAGGDTSLLERRGSTEIPLTSTDKMKIGRELRDDYKETKASLGYLNKLDALTSTKGRSPFKDIAATFTIMKALDPRSVVRESEFDLLSKAGGFIDEMNAIFNKAKGQGYITDYMKQSLRNTARSLRGVADEDQKRIRADQLKLTGTVGGGTQDLIPDLHALPALEDLYGGQQQNPAEELQRNLETLTIGDDGTEVPSEADVDPYAGWSVE